MSRILVVDDEPAILRGVTDNLKRELHQVWTAADGETAYQLIVDKKPDLVVLDLMLPKLSGYEICRRVRSEGQATLILMLTARGEETDRVVGLDMGADDYLTKPFSVRELLARVRALLRRTQHATAARPPVDQLSVDEIAIDFRKYEARKAGKPFDMTRREFQILQALASRPGEVVTRDELLNQVWGLEASPTTRTIDNHIAGLRAKLERDPEQPRRILTLRGVGYKWSPDA